jgi:hypothetical protein
LATDQAPTLHSNVVYQSVICMPKIPELEPPEPLAIHQGPVVDALPEPAGSLTDGQTPDRGES